MEGNLRFKIDWSGLIVGRKFTVFALFYFVFEGNFQVQAPRGAYIILEGQFNGGFFALGVWGAYTWRGLFFGIFWYSKKKGFRIHNAKRLLFIFGGYVLDSTFNDVAV